MSKLTMGALRAVLHYDPVSGVFTRIKQTGSLAPVGPIEHQEKRYLRICVDGERYYAHRLAWFYMTGKWPKEIDHKNTVKLDNRWKNLRDVSRSVNKQNLRGPTHASKTGRLGVHARGKKFMAMIGIGRQKSKYLGMFATLDLASKAYIRAKRILHSGNTL